MDFGTGRFLIRNAHSGNIAVLSDANYSTDIRGTIRGLEDELKGETVRRFSSGLYIVVVLAL